MVLKTVFPLLLASALVHAGSDPCTDGTYNEGEQYGIEGQCSSSYFRCVNGASFPMQCGPSTVWNNEYGYCDWGYNVDACSPENIVDCHDSAGNPATSGGYTKPGDCKGGTYYVCINGEEQTKTCADGLIFDPDTQVCDWAANQHDCDEESPDGETPDETTTTTAATTTSTTTIGTEPEDKTTTYSSTTTTTERITHDPPFDTTPLTTIKTTTEEIKDSNTTDPIEASTTTTTPKTPVMTTTTTTGGNKTTTTASTTTSTTTDLITHDPPFDTTPLTTIKTTTEKIEDSNTTDPIEASTTTTTPKTPIMTTTTTTKPQGDTFVGFVVDDTGSMSYEITGVKDWIISCVDGSSSSCGKPPTGGWVITSFNDPRVGNVVGPTEDIDVIISEVKNYYAHGGGDCPELGFTGLQNAVNVIPAENGGCKIFFFTDATAKDPTKADAVTTLYQAKGCSFIPVLTGCCGTCPAVCDTVDPEYYLTHVTDKTNEDDSCSTRIARSVKASIQTQFYTMAEETGGSIYVTNKPRSSDEMLDFLEDEVTLGFCDSSTVAGPEPDGYKCEEDCTAMGMCWDKSVSKCYCNGTSCTHTPMYGYSQCAGEQNVVCDPSVVIEIFADQKNCSGYFLCHSGTRYHYYCAPGTVYSDEAAGYCDHPANVPLPCGTKTGDDEDIM